MEKSPTKYTDDSLKGLGRGSRPQLTAVLRRAKGTITPALAAEVLSLPRTDAAKLLARWNAQGWLRRVRRGLYVPVPLESASAEVTPEDAWVVAEAAFAPCFICGWTAAEHWGLTEQVFRTVLVATLRRPRNRRPLLGGIEFRVRSVDASAFFGLKAVWRGQVRVAVTDPSRTVIDLLADPALGGGLRSSVDMLQNYLASAGQRDLARLIEYAQTLGVGAVFKRLGFLLERYAPQEQEAIAACRAALTQGNARLDPALPSRTLATAWRLWLPDGWSAG